MKRSVHLNLGALVLFLTSAGLGTQGAGSAWTYPLADWMSGMRGDVPLADLTMPAAHDAGVSEPCSSNAGWTDTLGLEELAEAQDLTLRGQMDVGVRFFDLRPCLVGGTLRTCHIAHDDVLWDEVGGCYGESLKSAFDAAAAFLAAHPTETLIFKISHWDHPVDGSSGDRTAAQEKFFNSFVYGYDSILLKWDTVRDGALPRLNALPLKKARGKLIVVCDGVSNRISPARGTWGYSDGTASAGYLGVYDNYADTDDCDEMINDQIGKWASQNATANTSRAFLLSWTLTMQTDFGSIVKGVVSGSIEDFADEANPRLSSVLAAKIAAGYKRPTFVLLDYVSETWSRVILPYNEPNERYPEALVSVGAATTGKTYSEMIVPVTAQIVDYGLTAKSAKVAVTLAPAAGAVSQTKEFALGGDLASHVFSAAFTGLNAGTKYNVTANVMVDGAVVKSAAGTLTTGYPPPAARVSIGSVTVGRDFAAATVPVTAQVTEYGAANSARVVVTLTPAGGGAKVTREFDLGGDRVEHRFSAAFDGLIAGTRYDVTAKVLFGEASGGDDDDRFFAADEFTWIDERATSFSAANWTGVGETVMIQDGALVIRTDEDSETTFTPEKKSYSSAQIVFRIRDCGTYEEGKLPDADGLAAISAIVRSYNRNELVVLGDGKWNATGIFFTNENANIDVVVDFDLCRHSVKYGVDGKTVGTYSLPNEVRTISSIVSKGYLVLSELVGTAENANLVRGADGNEYATFADAMDAGATGVLTPLWLSTWTLTGFSGVFDMCDPDNLVTCEKGSQTVKTESLGGGVTRLWYARLSDADIKAGAERYLKTTVGLKVVKAVTDESTVRIGDYLVANGEMSFTVEIDDVRVAKEAVRDFVEVKAKLSDAWGRPAEGDIDFKNGRVVVIPNRGGTSGFVRLRIRPDGEDARD